MSSGRTSPFSGDGAFYSNGAYIRKVNIKPSKSPSPKLSESPAPTLFASYMALTKPAWDEMHTKEPESPPPEREEFDFLSSKKGEAKAYARKRLNEASFVQDSLPPVSTSSPLTSIKKSVGASASPLPPLAPLPAPQEPRTRLEPIGSFKINQRSLEFTTQSGTEVYSPTAAHREKPLSLSMGSFPPDKPSDWSVATTKATTGETSSNITKGGGPPAIYWEAVTLGLEEVSIPDSRIPQQYWQYEDTPIASEQVLKKPEGEVRFSHEKKQFEVRVFPTSLPTTRSEVFALARAMDLMFFDFWTKYPRKDTTKFLLKYDLFVEEIGMWDVVFVELVRQVGAQCKERAVLLDKARARVLEITKEASNVFHDVARALEKFYRQLVINRSLLKDIERRVGEDTIKLIKYSKILQEHERKKKEDEEKERQKQKYLDYMDMLRQIEGEELQAAEAAQRRKALRDRADDKSSSEGEESSDESPMGRWRPYVKMVDVAVTANIFAEDDYLMGDGEGSASDSESNSKHASMQNGSEAGAGKDYESQMALIVLRKRLEDVKSKYKKSQTANSELRITVKSMQEERTRLMQNVRNVRLGRDSVAEEVFTAAQQAREKLFTQKIAETEARSQSLEDQLSQSQLHVTALKGIVDMLKAQYVNKGMANKEVQVTLNRDNMTDWEDSGSVSEADKWKRLRDKSWSSFVGGMMYKQQEIQTDPIPEKETRTVGSYTVAADPFFFFEKEIQTDVDTEEWARMQRLRPSERRAAQKDQPADPAVAVSSASTPAAVGAQPEGGSVTSEPKAVIEKAPPPVRARVHIGIQTKDSSVWGSDVSEEEAKQLNGFFGRETPRQRRKLAKQKKAEEELKLKQEEEKKRKEKKKRSIHVLKQVMRSVPEYKPKVRNLRWVHTIIDEVYTKLYTDASKYLIQQTVNKYSTLPSDQSGNQPQAAGPNQGSYVAQLGSPIVTTSSMMSLGGGGKAIEKTVSFAALPLQGQPPNQPQPAGFVPEQGFAATSINASGSASIALSAPLAMLGSVLGDQSFTEFVRTALFQKYGLKMMSNQYLADLLQSMRAYWKKSTTVKLFAKLSDFTAFCGVDDPSYSQSTFCLFLRVLLHAKTRFLKYDPDLTADARALIPLNLARDIARGSLEGIVLDQSLFDEIFEMLETLPTKKNLIMFDDFLEFMLEDCRAYLHHVTADEGRWTSAPLSLGSAYASTITKSKSGKSRKGGAELAPDDEDADPDEEDESAISAPPKVHDGFRVDASDLPLRVRRRKKKAATAKEGEADGATAVTADKPENPAEVVVPSESAGGQKASEKGNQEDGEEQPRESIGEDIMGFFAKGVRESVDSAVDDEEILSPSEVQRLKATGTKKRQVKTSYKRAESEGEEEEEGPWRAGVRPANKKGGKRKKSLLLGDGGDDGEENDSSSFFMTEDLVGSMDRKTKKSSKKKAKKKKKKKRSGSGTEDWSESEESSEESSEEDSESDEDSDDSEYSTSSGGSTELSTSEESSSQVGTESGSDWNAYKAKRRKKKKKRSSSKTKKAERWKSSPSSSDMRIYNLLKRKDTASLSGISNTDSETEFETKTRDKKRSVTVKIHKKRLHEISQTAEFHEFKRIMEEKFPGSSTQANLAVLYELFKQQYSISYYGDTKPEDNASHLHLHPNNIHNSGGSPPREHLLHLHRHGGTGHGHSHSGSDYSSSPSLYKAALRHAEQNGGGGGEHRRSPVDLANFAAAASEHSPQLGSSLPKDSLQQHQSSSGDGLSSTPAETLSVTDDTPSMVTSYGGAEHSSSGGATQTPHAALPTGPSFTVLRPNKPAALTLAVKIRKPENGGLAQWNSSEFDEENSEGTGSPLYKAGGPGWGSGGKVLHGGAGGGVGSNPQDVLMSLNEGHHPEHLGGAAGALGGHALLGRSVASDSHLGLSGTHFISPWAGGAGSGGALLPNGGSKISLLSPQHGPAASFSTSQSLADHFRFSQDPTALGGASFTPSSFGNEVDAAEYLGTDPDRPQNPYHAPVTPFDSPDFNISSKIVLSEKSLKKLAEKGMTIPPGFKPEGALGFNLVGRDGKLLFSYPGQSKMDDFGDLEKAWSSARAFITQKLQDAEKSKGTAEGVKGVKGHLDIFCKMLEERSDFQSAWLAFRVLMFEINLLLSGQEGTPFASYMLSRTQAQIMASTGGSASLSVDKQH